MNSQYVRAIAGFSNRTCGGGVLMWNVPTPGNGKPAEEETISVTLNNVPLSSFNVEAYIIDDRKRPGVSTIFWIALELACLCSRLRIHQI